MFKSFAFKCGVLIALAAIIAALIIYHSPIKQPINYGWLADTRSFFGIPNTLNVLSNIFFLWVGLLGLIRLCRPARKLTVNFNQQSERLSYIVFFLGTFLVGFGSSHYHWAPNNNALVWDRIPITIVLIGFFCAILGERVSLRFANILLFPFVIVGLVSVFYWHYSGVNGQGSLTLYAFIQVYTALVIPLILLMFKSPYSGTVYLWFALLFYVLARVFEQHDQLTYNLLHHIASGHTLKHLLASLSCYFVYLYLVCRKMKRSELTSAPSN